MDRSHNTLTLSLQRTLRRLTLLAAACGTSYCLPAEAQQRAELAPDASREENTAKEHVVFNLGKFQIREVRPTRNETIKVSFAAYFALSPDAGQESLQRLEHWKHRLRDQLIIAVRTAQNVDFQEPDLQRLRRVMLFRVRRLLKDTIVQDVLFSEFIFTME